MAILGYALWCIACMVKIELVKQVLKLNLKLTYLMICLRRRHSLTYET